MLVKHFLLFFPPAPGLYLGLGCLFLTYHMTLGKFLNPKLSALISEMGRRGVNVMIHAMGLLHYTRGQYYMFITGVNIHAHPNS